MALPDNLLSDVKEHLGITWDDEQTNKNVTGYIMRGISYLNDITGVSLDFRKEAKPKELLLEYCMYARSAGLSDFKNNYKSELVALQMQKWVENYEPEDSNV